MRKQLRIFANQLFVKYPHWGQWGYDFLRITNLTRAVRETQQLMRRFQTIGFTPSCILDVGANNGEWSKLVASVFPQATFTLIEPQAEMAPFLDHFCASYSHAQWVQAGAGAEGGELTFTVWDDFQGSSFLPVKSPNLQHKQRTVEIITVASLIESGKMPAPDLVKIDVQGFELEVLKGCTPCFGHTQLFIIETSLFETEKRPDIYTVIDYLYQYDYVVYDFPTLRYRPFDGALAQADICFVQKDGMFRQKRQWDVASK